MALIKHSSTCHIEYIDNLSDKSKRASTGKRRKPEPAKIMEQFTGSLCTADDQVPE